VERRRPPGGCGGHLRLGARGPDHQDDERPAGVPVGVVGALRCEPVVVMDAAEDGQGDELPSADGEARSSGYGAGIAWIACDGRALL
jgi:hypothetical protein